jgi:cyclophilin family peptidyl-prolyl cis-trans isomerase
MDEMNKFITISLAFIALLAFSASAEAKTRVAMETTKGTIVIELEDEKAPLTVKNFLAYVDSGHYKGTIFHRVIKKFVIQGGGLTADMRPKATMPPVKNEADNGLKNFRGTLSMARTNVVDSATSQFFVSTKDNTSLDHTAKTPRGWGYAVFGRVVEGMDVVDAIEATRTGTVQRFRDVPLDPITITDVKRLN